jgi:hypothetical protein
VFVSLDTLDDGSSLREAAIVHQVVVDVCDLHDASKVVPGHVVDVLGVTLAWVTGQSPYWWPVAWWMPTAASAAWQATTMAAA